MRVGKWLVSRKRLNPTSHCVLPQHGELFLAQETGPDRTGSSRKCWGPRGKENALQIFCPAIKEQ